MIPFFAGAICMLVVLIGLVIAGGWNVPGEWHAAKMVDHSSMEIECRMASGAEYIYGDGYKYHCRIVKSENR